MMQRGEKMALPQSGIERLLATPQRSWSSLQQPQQQQAAGVAADAMRDGMGAWHGWGGGGPRGRGGACMQVHADGAAHPTMHTSTGGLPAGGGSTAAPSAGRQAVAGLQQHRPADRRAGRRWQAGSGHRLA